MLRITAIDIASNFKRWKKWNISFDIPKFLTFICDQLEIIIHFKEIIECRVSIFFNALIYQN